MRETWVETLDQEDPLEKEMATHSSILAWREEPGWATYSPWGHKELAVTEQLHFHFHETWLQGKITEHNLMYDNVVQIVHVCI